MRDDVGEGEGGGMSDASPLIEKLIEVLNGVIRSPWSEGNREDFWPNCCHPVALEVPLEVGPFALLVRG